MFEKGAEEICSKYFEENCHKKNKWADTHDLVVMWQNGYNKAKEKFEKQVADLEWQLQEVAKDNDEYQKENAELKRDKKDLIFIRNQNAKCMCEDKEQLTKAKEIIKFLINPQLLDKPQYYEWRLKAEQFLKE